MSTSKNQKEAILDRVTWLLLGISAGYFFLHTLLWALSGFEFTNHGAPI